MCRETAVGVLSDGGVWRQRWVYVCVCVYFCVGRKEVCMCREQEECVE